MRLALAVALAASLGACDSEIEVDYRGRRKLADGDYRVLLPLTGRSARYVLVANNDGGGLELVDFEGPSCALGGAREIVAHRGSAGLRLSLWDRLAADGARAVRFADPQCEPQLERFEGVLGARLSAGTEPFWILWNREGEVQRVDPWRGRVHPIASDVRALGPYLPSGQSGRRGLWMLEGDSVVARDFEGREVSRGGRGALELSASSDTARSMAFATEEGIYSLSARGGSATRLHGSGCELRSATSAGLGSVVSFYSPCEQRRLQVALVEAQEVITVADDVRTYWFTTTFDRGGQPRVWIVYIQEPQGQPARYGMMDSAGEHFEFGVPVGPSSIMEPLQGEAPYPGRWLLLTDERPRRIGVWSPDEGFEVLAERAETIVGSAVGPIVLHEYEDGLGTASALERDLSLTPLARDVPRAGLVDAESLASPYLDTLIDFSGLRTAEAIVHEVQEGTGTLSLIERGLPEVAQRVSPGSIRAFFTESRGQELGDAAKPEFIISFLQDVDEDGGTLSLLTTDREALPIDEGVTSHRHDGDILEPGIVYNVSSGDRRGLWFAAE